MTRIYTLIIDRDGGLTVEKLPTLPQTKRVRTQGISEDRVTQVIYDHWSAYLLTYLLTTTPPDRWEGTSTLDSSDGKGKFMY